MNSDMSKYTITIYELLQNNFNFELDKYTIFDENYRKILNDAILNFYMFREIAFVNPIEFRFRLKARLDLIMRNKYNALYTAKAKDFNPLYTLEVYEDYSHTLKNTANGTSSYNTNSTTNTSSVDSNETNVDSTSENNGNNRNIHSVYPSDEMLEDELSDNIYVDSATRGNASDNSSENTKQNSTSNGTLNVVNGGNDNTTNSNISDVVESYNKKTYGSASDLSFAHAMTQFKDYCEQFQLDQQVIVELKDLFMSCW